MINEKTIHILRYGTVAEKNHLRKAFSAYDYLSINGNTAAFVSNAIAGFIVEKFFSNKKKGYFIDPITYAFQGNIDLLFSKSKNPNKNNIKKSIKKLIEIYGLSLEKIENRIPIVPKDFDLNINKKTFVERILSFQFNLVYDHINKHGLQKYLNYVAPEISKNLPQFRPKFLIAPYFYLDLQSPDWKKWLDLNVEFVKLAIEKINQNYKIPIFAQIVISKSLLCDNDSLEVVIKTYSQLNCDGFTIWIDDFNEQETSSDVLLKFVKLLRGLNNKPVYNMYGGYFSILLTHKSVGLLSGVSHGLEYGESRMVYPVGGGIPVSKYYFFPIHQRLDFTKAYYLLEFEKIIDKEKDNWGDAKKYYNKVCDCEQCKKVINNEMINFVEFESKEFYEIHRNGHVLRRKKASTETKQNCIYHYLLCKKKEFYITEHESIEKLLNDLSKNRQIFINCNNLKENELNYLLNWEKVLQEERELNS